MIEPHPIQNAAAASVPNDPLVIEASLRVPGNDVQLPEKAARAAMLFDSPQRRHVTTLNA